MRILLASPSLDIGGAERVIVVAARGLETVVVPNGVTAAAAPAPRDGDGPLVVAVGRLVAQKNHERLLLAARRVPGARFVVVGDGPLRGALEARARALGVDVRFT